MGCTKEDQNRIDELMKSISRDAELTKNEIFHNLPKYTGFKKNRKCNNAKRPKPRKK